MSAAGLLETLQASATVTQGWGLSVSTPTEVHPPHPPLCTSTSSALHVLLTHYLGLGVHCPALLFSHWRHTERVEKAMEPLLHCFRLCARLQVGVWHEVNASFPSSVCIGQLMSLFYSMLSVLINPKCNQLSRCVHFVFRAVQLHCFSNNDIHTREKINSSIFLYTPFDKYKWYDSV